MASGHTVICTVIFQGELNEIPSSWTLGRDITVTDPVCDEHGNIKQCEMNAGKGKFFPGSPTCEFCRAQIPCKYYITPLGGVTANILVDILRTLDEKGIYDCEKDKNTRDNL